MDFHGAMLGRGAPPAIGGSPLRRQSRHADRARARAGLLEERLAAARAGESSALVVQGEPGAGKTALLDALVARADGVRVLRATGVESESDLPYAGLAELLAPVLALREAIPAPQRAAVERALALTEEGTADRFVVGAALVSMLAEAAPVLCAIDDAHWLDAATLDAVRFAARRLANEGVCMLIGTREELRPLGRSRSGRWATTPRSSSSARKRLWTARSWPGSSRPPRATRSRSSRSRRR